jgi:hypothetical protein
LARYAEDHGAAGILFTCSAFGEAIEAAAAQARVPVLKPNEAMFEAALAAGKRLGMLATFQPSVAGMEAEFRDIAGAAKSQATLDSFCVPGAMKALQEGDGAEHDQLVAIAAPRFADRDAVLLAHFSTSRAAAAVQGRGALPGAERAGRRGTEAEGNDRLKPTLLRNGRTHGTTDAGRALDHHAVSRTAAPQPVGLLFQLCHLPGSVVSVRAIRGMEK